MPILKIILGGFLIWIVSEVGKSSGKLGGLILSLPTTSILAILWLWFETKDPSKIASLSSETSIFILPSFVFFVSLPLLLQRPLNFYLAFAISIVLTFFAYALFFKLRTPS